MKLQAEENLELRRYLLRELTEAETLRVSARLFLESEYSQQLQAAEEDLIDEYVYDELSADERKRVETYFLSEPERYEDLKIAQALKKYISTEPDSSPVPKDAEEIDVITPPRFKDSFWTSLWTNPQSLRLVLAAAVLVVVVGGAWLILKSVRRQNQPGPVQAQLPTQQGDEGNSDRQREENGLNREEVNKNPPEGPGQQVARNKDRTSVNSHERASTGNGRQSNLDGVKTPTRQQTGIYALLIPVEPMRDDGGTVKTVVLTDSAKVVNLQLALISKDAGRSYQATLQTDDGRTIKTWTGLKSTKSKSGEIVSIRVPVNLFDQQKYSVALKAVTASGNIRDINTYPFQILKPPSRASRVP